MGGTGTSIDAGPRFEMEFGVIESDVRVRVRVRGHVRVSGGEQGKKDETTGLDGTMKVNGRTCPSRPSGCLASYPWERQHRRTLTRALPTLVHRYRMVERETLVDELGDLQVPCSWVEARQAGMTKKRWTKTEQSTGVERFEEEARGSMELALIE
jgi:hypothetical protein